MATDPDVRIHIAQLDAFDPSVGTDWLTSDEAARLRAMTAPQRKRSFIAGHWLARHAAGEWLDLDPRQVAVRHHADGRPYLHVDAGLGNNIIDIMRSSGRSDGDATPFLSIAHSGALVAVAIASVPVGIDVETSRKRRDLRSLARFALSPAEAELIAASDAPHDDFLRLWTLKEARGKRTGEGFLPEVSRSITATPCNPDASEAITWALMNGSLAVAVEAGTRVEFTGEREPGERAHWRFL